jgi:hypothetical protein
MMLKVRPAFSSLALGDIYNWLSHGSPLDPIRSRDFGRRRAYSVHGFSSRLSFAYRDASIGELSEQGLGRQETAAVLIRGEAYRKRNAIKEPITISNT